jgi:hypothetical protein
MTADNTTEAAQRRTEREATERDIITEAGAHVWNEPDPDVVKLHDRRQVLRSSQGYAACPPERPEASKSGRTLLPSTH